MSGGRIIVDVFSDLEGKLEARLAEFPGDVPDALRSAPLTCDPDAMPAWSRPDAVREHGAQLRQALAAHPAIRRALDALALTPAGQRQPLFFSLAVPDAERLVWEALVDEQGRFLALDPRWPIVRIAASAVANPQAAAPRAFQPPLRIAALLSARGLEAEPEWLALQEAVDAARAGGLPIEVSLFVGERALLDTLRDEIADGTLQDVSVAPVPETWPELQRPLDEFAPHLLHVFSHGQSQVGVRELVLGTLAHDVDLHADVDAIAASAAVRGAWLVTLNCCEGGRPAEDLPSMAHRLVTAGAAAVLGMLEPVDAQDAHRLCELLYPVVLDRIAAAVAASANGGAGAGPGGGAGAGAAGGGPHVSGAADLPVELEWSAALEGPRVGLRDLHGRDPANHRQWALPVLYVRREILRLRGGPDLSDQQRRVLGFVSGLVASLPPAQLEPAIVIWAEGELQRVAVPLALWPARLTTALDAGGGSNGSENGDVDAGPLGRVDGPGEGGAAGEAEGMIEDAAGDGQSDEADDEPGG